MRKTHKIIRSFFAAWFLVTFLAQAAPGGEEFAPKVTPPQNMENRSMWMEVIEKWDIPDKTEVEVPAYPGAFVVAYAPASEMEANGVKSETFPAIVLATSDDRAKVTSFYKEKLKEWKYKNSKNMFDVFWTGRDEFNSMDITQAAITSNVNIMDAISVHTDYMPNAKTAITIVYRPGK